MSWSHVESCANAVARLRRAGYGSMLTFASDGGAHLVPSWLRVLDRAAGRAAFELSRQREEVLRALLPRAEELAATWSVGGERAVFEVVCALLCTSVDGASTGPRRAGPDGVNNK